MHRSSALHLVYSRWSLKVFHDVQVHNVKRFWVLNPTSMAYSFAWEAVDTANPGSPASPFHCSTMTGVLAPGKRYEMVFQYTPSEDKLQVLPAALLCAVTCSQSRLYMTSLAAWSRLSADACVVHLHSAHTRTRTKSCLS